MTSHDIYVHGEQVKTLLNTLVHVDGVLATPANLTATYGAFCLMSCDLHPAILWKTERARGREREREPHKLAYKSCVVRTS